MIFELPKSDYKKVRPLFAREKFPIAVKALTEQVLPGTIFVDDLDNPKTACLWPFTSGGNLRLYLGGTPTDAFSHSLGQLLTGDIATEANTQEKDIFLLYSPQGSLWEDHLLGNKIFENLRVYTRSYHAFKEVKISWKEKVPPGYSIKSIDKNLLENKNLENLDRVRQEIASMNPSIDNWLEEGFGFCTIHDEKKTIVSWCTAEYIVGSKCEFGIETVEEYQNQGFGTLTAAAAAEYGSSQGFSHLGWDAWTDNIESIKVAEKVGYEKVAEYSVYIGCFDPHLHQLYNGYYELRVKRNPGKSAEIYEQALQTGENEAIHYFTAACAYAQLKETESALKYLERAVEKGWTDIKHEDLIPLHTSPGWGKVTKSLVS
ncbi:MAG: GNAT family N-acetyltransferase [Candidatus Hodarchaeales archaeon]|jgi:RimJ/RimL family protein N-acetyltransferase